MRRSTPGSRPPRRAASSSTFCPCRALYIFARRRYDSRVALGAMAALAVLPVHAIYAGFVLRESLVTVLSILAVWTLTEVWQIERSGWKASGLGRHWPGSAAAWPCWHGRPGWRSWPRRVFSPSSVHGRKRPIELLLWAAAAVAVCLPWAWVTLHEYETPFYSYTKYFEYNFSWTVHHYDKGNTRAVAVLHLGKSAGDRPGEGQVAALDRRLLDDDPGPADRRWAIFAGCSSARWARARNRSLVAAIFVVFVLATLKRVADVTQVAAAWALLYAGIRAHVADRGRRDLRWLDSLPDARAGGAVAGRHVLCARVGTTRPGHYDASGWSNRFSFTGPLWRRPASGSRPTPTWCLPGHGS